MEINYIIDEINKLAEYEQLEQVDIDNGYYVANELNKLPLPIVEFTSAGFAFTWPRFELVFEYGYIYYFRYRKDRTFGWKPQEIGGGLEEGFLTPTILEKIKYELRLLSQTE